MQNEIVFALVTFLHDLFTVIWIGGLFTLGLIVLPTARQVFGPGPDTKRLMASIQKRLSKFICVSIVGLIVTGVLLSRSNPSFQGLFSFANSYSTALGLKHIAVIAMIIIMLYRSLVLGRKKSPLTPSQEKLSVALLFANLVIGIVVLLLSGFTAAMGL